MGCWNETCGLTQLPICGGDPVRMFLIVERKPPRGYTRDHVMHYSSDLWRPYGLPIKGTYDEYGGLENIEEDCMSDFLLEAIREGVVEVPNRMGEVFKREELDWETAINFLTDEGLNITDPFDVANITKKLDAILAEVKAKVPNLPDNGWSSERSDMAKEQKKVIEEDSRVVKVYHMMVHEDVYQAVLNYKVPAERFSSWTDGDIREEMRKGAKDYLVKVREYLAELAKVPEEEKSMFILRNRLGRFDDDYRNIFVSIANHLDGSYGSGSYLRKYLDFVEKRIAAGATDDDPQIQMLTEQFVGFAAFSQTMTLMRKLWMPQTGKGGQDREYAMHRYIGQTIANFSDKKVKEWEADMAEYEEEDAEEDAQESK